jgi:hypothetical protein
MRQLKILILVFALPFVAAQSLYWFRDSISLKTLETGTLLTPPLQTQVFSFFDPNTRGKWQLIYIKPTVCDANCTLALSNLNRIHAALGKDRPRLVCRTLSQTDLSSLSPGELAVIDPQGWLILQYAAHSRPMGIIKDLQRLLKFSHVG